MFSIGFKAENAVCLLADSSKRKSDKFQEMAVVKKRRSVVIKGKLLRCLRHLASVAYAPFGLFISSSALSFMHSYAPKRGLCQNEF